MKFTLNLILILLFIPLFLIGLFTSTIKLQILDARFWESTFTSHNVYSGITGVVKTFIEEQAVKEGGSKSEVKIITDIVTTENIRSFINKNIENILNYANQKSGQLLVFIPVGLAPKGFLPKNFANLPETMTLTSLLSKLNVSGVSQSQIQYISILGRSASYLLTADLAFTAIVLVLLFVLVSPGSRYIAPGIGFVLSGLLTLSLYIAGIQIQTQMINFSVQKSSLAESIVGAVSPSIISEVLKVWVITGVCAIIIGVVLLFLKKPMPRKLVSR